MSSGRRIGSLVTLDLETTGLPWQEHRRTRVTELALVGAAREAIATCPPAHALPRVLHKLTLCVYPRRMIAPQATDVTGLSNEILENEKTFDKEACDLFNLFLSRQTPPVCLVAHNGMKFDFPILQSEFKEADSVIADDILCVDSLTAFKALFSNIPLEMLPSYMKKKRNASKGTVTNTHVMELSQEKNDKALFEDRSFMQQINETTPRQERSFHSTPPEILQTLKVKRQLFTQDANETQPQLNSFKLHDIYHFLTGKLAIDSHHAEGDAVVLMACITAMGEDFIEWADENAVHLSTVQGLR